jgi:hypothetical protein
MPDIVGANTRGTKIVSLYGRLFSPAVAGHESENIEIRQTSGEVAGIVGKRGFSVMARGGDRGHLLRIFCLRS